MKEYHLGQDHEALVSEGYGHRLLQDGFGKKEAEKLCDEMRTKQDLAGREGDMQMFARMELEKTFKLDK